MVCLRHNPNVFHHYDMTESRVRTLAQSLDDVIERRNLDVVFIPMHANSASGRGDALLHERVAKSENTVALPVSYRSSKSAALGSVGLMVRSKKIAGLVLAAGLAAGGNPSWNTGVNYFTDLAKSADFKEVVALYRAAGLSLTKDLLTLNSAPRVKASPNAEAYLIKNISFNGRISVPVLTMHTTGDGLVVPENEQAYRSAVPPLMSTLIAMVKNTTIAAAFAAIASLLAGSTINEALAMISGAGWLSPMSMAPVASFLTVSPDP